MFEARQTNTMRRSLFSMLEVTYHASVQKVRSSHRNAVWAIMTSILQAGMFVGGFYLMFYFIGAREAKLRGDFMMYLLSGIYLYLCHIRTVAAVSAAEGGTSSLMQHGPMDPIVAIASSLISAFYVQTISLLVILFALHTFSGTVPFHNWKAALMIYLLAWFSGFGVGLVFRAMRPWSPEVTRFAQQAYMRINMVASGKMFVANMVPGFIISMFDWNPLFHIVDQMRGAVFVNYLPHHTNWEYPLFVACGLLIVGLMAEFFTTKRASMSWDMGR